jgi:hypothetical protein
MSSDTAVKESQYTYPVMAMIARDYLAAQATSVPCERDFSSSKRTDTPERVNTSSEVFEARQMVKSAYCGERHRLLAIDEACQEHVYSENYDLLGI